MYQIYVEIWEATKSSRKVLIYRMYWQLKIYAWIFLITLGCYVVLNTVFEADRIMTDNTVLFPETVNVLSALKKSNAKIGIISTKYRYRIKECLDRNLDENIVDIIIGGEDVEHPKPSPEGLKFAIKQLDLEKSSVLYIGDSTVDAETALHAAVDFAGVLNGVTTSDELAAYPHVAVMNDLNGLL